MRAPQIKPRGKSGYVPANGIRLHYLEYGSGVELVIVPGITSPAITWEFVSEALASDHHVFTMDVRGRGLSDKPASGFSLPDYAADVAGFVKGLGLRHPVVLGHSMGARIVAAFGALHPEIAGALIIVDPPLSGPGRAPYPSPLEVYTGAIKEAEAGATAEDMRPYFPTWTDEQLQLRADWLATCDETAITDTHRNFQLEDFFEYWRQLQPPVLFMYGGNSPAVSEAGANEVAQANPRAQTVCIPGAAHMIPWDRLDAFTREVRAFTASTRARP